MMLFISRISVFSIAAAHDYEIELIDVDTAFLQAEISREQASLPQLYSRLLDSMLRAKFMSSKLVHRPAVLTEIRPIVSQYPPTST